MTNYLWRGLRLIYGLLWNALSLCDLVDPAIDVIEPVIHIVEPAIDVIESLVHRLRKSVDLEFVCIQERMTRMLGTPIAK
jgi:hypothetical protein